MIDDCLAPVERGIEFLAASTRGLTYKQIGDACHASPFTVRAYLHHLRREMGVRNTTEAVAKAITLGMIVLDDDGQWVPSSIAIEVATS